MTWTQTHCVSPLPHWFVFAYVPYGLALSIDNDKTIVIEVTDLVTPTPSMPVFQAMALSTLGTESILNSHGPRSETPAASALMV